MPINSSGGLLGPAAPLAQTSGAAGLPPMRRGLLDVLRGWFGQEGGVEAQAPGEAAKPRGLLDNLLAPEVALPMAAQLLQQNGNSANFGNAFAAAGPALRQNQTRRYIEENDPELAELMRYGLEPKDAFEMMLERQKATKAQTPGRYKSVGGRVFDTSTESWIDPPGGAAPETGLSTVLMEDENGNMIYAQPTKDGQLLQSKVPEGFRPVSPYSTNLMRQAGKNDADLIATMGSDIAAAEATVRQIDDLVGNPDLGINPNPGLNSILGSFDQYRDTWTLGPQGNDALARWKQLNGRAFLQAYGMLKGGGQITEIEGEKAQAAMARMERAQDEATFTQAMREFRDAVSEGSRKLRAVGSRIPDPRAGSVRGTSVGGQPAPAGGAAGRTSKGLSFEVVPD